jgi:hypothetical protein
MLPLIIVPAIEAITAVIITAAVKKLLREEQAS